MGVQEPSSERVKVDEKVTQSGSSMVFYCSKGGPSLSELMKPIYRLAIDYMLTKSPQSLSDSTRAGDTILPSPMSKEDDWV